MFFDERADFYIQKWEPNILAKLKSVKMLAPKPTRM